MVENMRTTDGDSPEGERRKTAIVREGPPRREVLSAMEETPGAFQRRAERVVATGTLLEGLAGTCAAALAVIAIVGTFPLTLTAVGVIVLGGSILFSGGGFAAIAGRLWNQLRSGQMTAGGAGLEAFAGAAALAGGILVLVNVVPTVLLPVSLIVLGTCFLLSSGGYQFFLAEPELTSGKVQNSGATGASAVEILVGLSAIALSVLALAGLNTLMLSEIALLALGIGILAKCMVFSASMAAHLGGN